MAKYFTDKEYKMIDAINSAVYLYIESIDQTEEMNAPPEIHELTDFLGCALYNCFKLQFSNELQSHLDKMNLRNVVPIKNEGKKNER